MTFEMVNWAEKCMRSTSSDAGPVPARRAWQAPAITELPISSKTRSTATAAASRDRSNPPPPAAPTTKLGFSFEMSFPLSVRTE
jgi:hypothetical protein